MPVPMRSTSHKAEAKYNVTTEFPSLGLHSAAATGNVGLVEYALRNGQPINSVLDGVLPLHAACAGGNVQVVKVLIDHGADVNAPRLPRKYSNDKNRDSSAPIVGTSGSTPLHFAAANGNTEVVSLLLLHGAHADRPDKHGITPEMLALENGWVECAKALREWINNKDRDLREREDILGRTTPSLVGHAYADPQSSASRRRLHVKRSIDTAFNLLKTPESGSKAAISLQASTPPASPTKPSGEYTFYPTNDSPVEYSSRRPSLPHVLQSPSETSPRDRKPSAASTPDPKQRRPRSAGTGADRSPEQEQPYPVYGRGGSGRKLGSKYSLLNLFKKGQHGDATDGALNPSENASSIDISGPSAAATPGSLQTAPSYSGQASVLDFTQSSSLASAPARLASKHRGSDASSRSVGRFITPQSTTLNPPPLPRKPSGDLRTPLRPNPPSAVELHLALAQQQQQQRNQSLDDAPGESADQHKPAHPPARLNALLSSGHNRNRSASSTSAPVDNRTFSDDGNTPASYVSPDDGSKPSPSPRPGILRAHNRSPSVGQGGSPIPRTLRFDSSSSNPDSDRRVRDSPRSVPSQLRSYNSASSLTKLNIEIAAQREDNSPVSDIGIEAPSRDEDVIDEDGDHDDNYGQPIVGDHLMGDGGLPSVLLQRQRGQSFTSSSESSLSPILANEDPSSSVLAADFPFSINRAPLEEQVSEATSTPAYLNVPVPSDTRNRGDSLSSDSTSDSRGNMPMSLSNSSGSGTNVTVVSPGLSDNLVLPYDPYKREPVISADQVPIEPPKKHVPPPLPLPFHNLNERRAHSPLDIDLSAISSHAQAEALVARARQEALEVAGSQDANAPPGSLGRTPLSARLAAYGESLALEKKLREQKEAESAWRDREQDGLSIQLSSGHGAALESTLPRQKSREGVERQLSLENRTGSAHAKKRIKDPRRPSTADGPSSGTSSAFFAPRTPSHQSSRSTSTSKQSPVPLRDQTGGLHSSPRAAYVPLDATVAGEASTLGIARDHTSVVPSEDSLDLIQSADDVDTETDSTSALHCMTSSPPISNPREKQVRTAKKLTKMGIAVADQAAAASRATPTPSTPPTSKRFGLKSFMQTFKGKA